MEKKKRNLPIYKHNMLGTWHRNCNVILQYPQQRPCVLPRCNRPDSIHQLFYQSFFYLKILKEGKKENINYSKGNGSSWDLLDFIIEKKGQS